MWKLVGLACNYLGLAGIHLIISILCNTPHFYDLILYIPFSALLECQPNFTEEWCKNGQPLYRPRDRRVALNPVNRTITKFLNINNPLHTLYTPSTHPLNLPKGRLTLQSSTPQHNSTLTTTHYGRIRTEHPTTTRSITLPSPASPNFPSTRPTRFTSTPSLRPSPGAHTPRKLLCEFRKLLPYPGAPRPCQSRKCLAAIKREAGGEREG
jgi:hypothetical protein